MEDYENEGQREEEETWGALDDNDNEEFSNLNNPVGAVALVNGGIIELEVGADFKETAGQIAHDAGFGKFKVYLWGTVGDTLFEGEEVKPSDVSNALISDGMKLKVTAFDVAGQ